MKFPQEDSSSQSPIHENESKSIGKRWIEMFSLKKNQARKSPMGNLWKQRASLDNSTDDLEERDENNISLNQKSTKDKTRYSKEYTYIATGTLVLLVLSLTAILSYKPLSIIINPLTGVIEFKFNYSEHNKNQSGNLEQKSKQ
jgi:hypothetical protein